MADNARADLILRSGKVITLDARSCVCEAIAVAGERIVAVGRDDEVLEYAAPGARIADLKGRAVIPGLIDVHAHLDREGLKDVFPSLAGARSLDDILQRIADLARIAGKGEWIVTMPIGEPPFYDDPVALLAEGRYPNRWDIDRAAPDNPVYIRPVWGYWRDGRNDRLISIVNSKALEIAGITRGSQPPSPSVEIETDPETGDPTGVFIEATAMPVMELTLLSMAPGFTTADRMTALTRSLRAYNRVGTTGIFEGHGIAPEVLDGYRALHKRGALTVRSRLVHSPAWQSIGDVEPARFLAAWGGWLGNGGLGDAILRIEGLYAEIGPDADNLARAAAHPYTGWAGFHYDCGLPQERQVEVLTAAAQLGIRPTTISIAFLDIYNEVNRTVPIRDRRWIIQHVGHLVDDQIARIRDLGLVVSPLTIQSIYKRRPSGGAAAVRPRPGSRLAPLKSLLKAGVGLGLATDNLPVSMFHAIWHSVARRDKNGEIVAPAEERLTREEALRAATLGGAYFTFEENERGSIEPGKLADLAVLSDDPLTCEEDVLKDIVAEMTFLGGRCVFDGSV